MKNTYYCAERKVDMGKVNMGERSGERYIAFPIKCSKGHDLLAITRQFADLLTVTPCETLKEAKTMSDVFNDGYLKNGCYVFQESEKVTPSSVYKF